MLPPRRRRSPSPAGTGPGAQPIEGGRALPIVTGATALDGSDPALAGEQSAVDSGQQGGMVAFGLVGVAPREPAEELVGLVAPAEVAGDHRRTAGAGMSLREQQSADAGVVGQRRGVDAVDD